MRSKRELIKAFIEEKLPKLKPDDNVITEFECYWSNHQKQAFSKLCDEEQIKPVELEKRLNTYTFPNRFPRKQEIVSSLT